SAHSYDDIPSLNSFPTRRSSDLIVKKFDERIGSLDEQLKDYEKQWREKRIVKVQEVIANVLNESNLKEKYAARLVVDDDHLKKNITNNRLKEMIEFQA